MTLAISQPLALDTGKYGDEGRFVTLHSGQVIFITDNAGFVPKHLRADAGEAKRFSRAAIERKLVEHHREMTGGDVTAHDDAELNSHTSGNPFTFHKALPEEVKHELAGNPHLRRLFRVTQNAGEAGGADTLHAMGERRYFDAAHRYAGSSLRQAKEFAAQSPDPEVQFLASIHEHLPTDSATAHLARATRLHNQANAGQFPRGAVEAEMKRQNAGGNGSDEQAARATVAARMRQQANEHAARAKSAGSGEIVPVKANELRVGQQFSVHGVAFRVAEDADGYRVLQHGHDYSEETPLDALTTIPVDAGSFKRGRSPARFKEDAVAPFSADPIDGVRLVRIGEGRTVRVPAVRAMKLPGGRVLALGGDTHKFSSTQINLPSEHAAAVLAMAHQIKDEDLAEDGRETDPHVTVRYGLHSTRPSEVAPALADESPVTFKLGKASLFPATKERLSDVIKLDVEGPDLHRLNTKLARLPHTQTYPTYHPHVTLAYVKPGMGAKYLPKMNRLAGTVVAAKKVRFSSHNGMVADIPLGAPLALAGDLFGRGSTGGSQGHLFSKGDKEDGVWRTIEGTHVFIRGGKITKGPHALEGKTVAEVKATPRGAEPQDLHEGVTSVESARAAAKPAPAAAAEELKKQRYQITKDGKTVGVLKHLVTEKGPRWLLSIYGEDGKDKLRYFNNFDQAHAAAYKHKPAGSLLERQDAPRATAPVDTSRQLGIFAKDAKGNPVEVGERPGQTSMFGTAKPAAKSAETPAQSSIDARIAKQYDPAATPELPGIKGTDATPREKAAAVTSKMMATDYAFARPSAVSNAGADLADSARHKRNAWRGLADAEANGTAQQLVTRDKLLENEPHNLAAAVENHPHTALAMHYAMRSLPAKPGYRGRGGDEKDRREFHETYQAYKAEAERLAQTEPDPLKAVTALRNWTSSRIQQLRGQKSNDSIGMATATDRHNATANALVGTYKDLRLGGGVTSVSGKMREFAKAANTKYGAEAGAKSVPHVRDLIAGKSLPESFGTSKEDTKPRFDPSDRYIGKPVRVGGRDLSSVTGDPNAATQHMLSSFGMRGVQWGNSVSDDERVHHAKHVVEALTDLADVTGLHPQDISINGKLGLAIGARGHGGASAHYEPGNKVINLTRAKGVGTLAHEWGHAFDHDLAGGGISQGETKSGGDYQSNRVSPKRFVRAAPGEPTAYGRFKADDKGQLVTEDLSTEPVWAAMEGVRQAQKSSGFSKRARETARAYVEKGLMSHDKANNYWLSNQEMFARSFEQHVQHKLKSAGRDNTYLSGLNSGGGLWPTKEESAHMAPAFDALMAAYRQKKYGSPAPIAFSAKDVLDALALSDLFGDENSHWVTLPGGRHVLIHHKQGDLFNRPGISRAPTSVAGEGTSGNQFTRRDSSGLGVAGVDAAIERLTREHNAGGLAPKTITEGYDTTLDTAKGRIRVSTSKIRDGHYAHEVMAEAKGSPTFKVMHKSRSTDASVDDAQRKHANLVRRYHERLLSRGDAVSVHGDVLPNAPKGLTLPSDAVKPQPRRSIYDVMEKPVAEDAFDRAMRESEERDRRWREREKAREQAAKPALHSDNPAAEPDMTIQKLKAHEAAKAADARAAESSLNRFLAKRAKRRGEGHGLAMSAEELALSATRPMIAKCKACGSYNLSRIPNVAGGRSLDTCRDCGAKSVHSPGSLTAQQCAPSDYDRNGDHKDQSLPWQ